MCAAYTPHATCLGRLMSNDPAHNPTTYDWNHVLVPYCDGMSFTGAPSRHAARLPLHSADTACPTGPRVSLSPPLRTPRPRARVHVRECGRGKVPCCANPASAQPPPRASCLPPHVWAAWVTRGRGADYAPPLDTHKPR